MAQSISLPDLTEREIDRFWIYVQKSDDGCWLWTGGRSGNNHNYGQFMVGRRHCYAHRISWTLQHGAIPPNLLVCHDCPGGDNPLCVRPDHLFLGTLSDNVQDAIRKGRMRFENRPKESYRGERNAMARLRESDVQEIRQLYAAGVSQGVIATQFGVTRPHISGITRRKFWGWLPDQETTLVLEPQQLGGQLPD